MNLFLNTLGDPIWQILTLILVLALPVGIMAVRTRDMHASADQKRRETRGVLLLCLIVFVPLSGGELLFHAWQVSPPQGASRVVSSLPTRESTATPTPTSDPSADPTPRLARSMTQVLTTFCDAITTQDYQTAWNQYASSLQRTHLESETFAACSNTPAPPSATPVATGSALPTMISAYHGHTSTVFAVAFSPEGTRVASGGNDSTVQVWDARTGQLLVKYSRHTGTVYALSWSPDGRRIASMSQDATAQVWDATSGRHVLTYRGQAAPLWAAAWSPTGVCLASASGNMSDEHQRETVQVWNAATGQLLISYPVPSSAGQASGTLSVAWSPEGARIASGGAQTIVHLWKTPASCKK